MYKPGDRPNDLAKAQTEEDNIPAEGQKGVEVPKVDEDGNPIETNSTQAQTNSTSNTITASNVTLAESNSTGPEPVSANTTVNATNSTSVAKTKEATSADVTQSDDWDTDIVQTKDQKTAIPSKSEFTGPTDIDDLSLKSQMKTNETIIVKK